MVDVDVPRESAREVKYIELAKIDAVILMEQMQSGDVCGLGLRQLADVLLGQVNIVFGIEPKPVGVVGQPAATVDPPGAKQFAQQVDQAGAAFDNLQVFEASRHPDRGANLAHVEKAKGRFPVKKSIREEHEIRKRNLHARFHLDDPAYRKLVGEIDRLDAEKIERFPEAFSSHKAFQKKIQKLRKKLHQEDSVYKETLFATFRANRAMDQYLVDKEPSIEKQPDTRKKAALERARKKHQGDAGYKKLVTAAEEAQKKLESDYPQLFVSNEEITEKRNKARQTLKGNPDFKKLSDTRAAAYNAQQDYLYENDEKLAQLKKSVEEEKTQTKNK